MNVLNAVLPVALQILPLEMVKEPDVSKHGRRVDNVTNETRHVVIEVRA